MKVIGTFLLIISLPLFSRGNNGSIPFNNGTDNSLEYISELEEQLEKLKEELLTERVSRVVALALPENYGKAEVLYNQLNNISLIDPIMEQLYGDPYHEPLVGFTSIMLHTMQERLLAYRKWVTLLEINEDLLEGGILVFWKLINDQVTAPGATPPPELVDLNKKLEIYADTVLRLWIRAIRRGDYAVPSDFGSPPDYPHIIGQVFETVLEKIVVGVMEGGETEYFKKALEFVIGLKWNIHRYVGMKAVYDNLAVDDDRRLVVAYRIKEQMEGCFEGPDPSDNAKEFFKALKESLSQNVQNLLWHERCNLRNKEEDEYLYGDQEAFNSENRKVFTWVPGGERDEGRFFFVPTVNDVGDGLIFQIESKYYPDFKYLDGHTTGAGDGPYKKYVSLQKNTPSGYNWRVELSTLPGEVKLFHLPLNGYLMGDFILTGDKRTAVIWTSDLQPASNLWTLECIRT